MVQPFSTATVTDEGASVVLVVVAGTVVVVVLVVGPARVAGIVVRVAEGEWAATDLAGEVVIRAKTTTATTTAKATIASARNGWTAPGRPLCGGTPGPAGGGGGIDDLGSDI